jgi:group I intron endonuclease
MKNFIIYEITNKINGKSYIGQYSGKSFKTYFGSGKLIKYAIKKYGIDNFEKVILEECTNKEELNEKEIFWIKQKETIQNGYNLIEGGTGGDLSNFIDYNEEWREKQRKNAKNYWANLNEDERKIRSNNVSSEKNGMYGKVGFWKDKKLSEEMIKKMLNNRRSFLGEDNPNWKGGKSIVYCECGKKIGYGHTHCNKCRPRSEKNNPFYGKTHTDETKNKLSEKRIGTYNGEQNIPIIIDNVEYRSAGEASKILNIPMVTIRWRVKSKNKKFENYKYKAPLSN